MTERARPITTLGRLTEAGLVAPTAAKAMAGLDQRYAIAISPAMAALIDPTDQNDPIARQFVPDARELRTHPAEIADPIGDHPHTPVAGIVHRYTHKALLKIVSICPVYCRFCFRREMVGPQHGGVLSDEAVTRALSYIAEHDELEEIIMTGGDPLVLSPRRIAALTARVREIPHVRRLRWHSRVPVVTPDRITDRLVAALAPQSGEVRVAVHANHAAEFTPEAREACRQLHEAGITLLSQTVLLRGINDDVETLAALLRTFEDNAITPYYIHHGDLAPGTAHFRTKIETGKKLMAALVARHPGQAMPRYVLDVPGGYGKVALDSEAVTATGAGLYRITTPAGAVVSYRDATVGA